MPVMIRLRPLPLLLAFALAMTMATEPAYAGKKKKAGSDPTHGAVFTPPGPITHHRPITDSVEEEAPVSATAPMEAEAPEPPPKLYVVSGVENLRLPQLFR